MKIIIAGSRNIHDYCKVEQAVASFITNFENITEIISGGCEGVDKLGEIYAQKNNIPLKIFRANWGKYGKSAGPIRNAEMANYADALIAIWDGSSKGTMNMIENAKTKGLIVHVC